MKILLSIIICTRNRSAELTGSLRTLAPQARKFPDVEVLIVDNGSTDDTKDTVQRLVAELGFNFRYVFEPVAGLCQARNRGRSEALGGVLAYLDDDEEIGSDWVGRVRDHFREGNAAVLGGKIGVRLESEPPFPIDEEMMWFFCTTTLGEHERFLTYPEHPNGGNMAFKTEVFDEVGGFDTNLKLYGDETEFFRRVSEKGIAMYYDPVVEVVQVIPPDRLTKEELRYKSTIRGKGAASVWLLASPGNLRRIAQIGEYLMRVAYMRLRLLTNNTFGKFFTYWFYRGYLLQLLRGSEVS